MGEEKASIMGSESDLVRLEKKDGINCEVKWTQEEVSTILQHSRHEETGCTLSPHTSTQNMHFIYHFI